MPRRLLLSAFLFIASQAAASDRNLSGRYVDVKGAPVVLSQAGKSLSVQPDMKGRPEQVRQFLPEIKLTGTVTPLGDAGFALSANYLTTVKATPDMKLKVTVEFNSTGEQSTEGLIMKTCEWQANLIVFSQGEIAGSENHVEKCVGLWKRQ